MKKIKRILIGSLAVFAGVNSAFAATEFASQKINVGRFQSRAIWTPVADPSGKSPVVILVPGSGANGPEEMMPASYTGDGQEHSLFAEFSAPLNRAGITTLALGKPGIEFHSSWEPEKFFYDKDLYKNLHWKDLITNLADAVDYVRHQEGVDLNRIYILGHSEGTQVAVDYGHVDPSVAGVLLLGYAGEDIGTIINWQIYQRAIDLWIKPDVDLNHDGYVSREEASPWPEFARTWREGEDKVSFIELEDEFRKDPDGVAAVEKLRNSPLYADGIFSRGPMYDLTATLTPAVYIFTGALDPQTRPEEALAAQASCQAHDKKNCHVTLVPGLGHGFSVPKGPRKQVLLDATLGPVDPGFQDMLEKLGKRL